MCPLVVELVIVKHVRPTKKVQETFGEVKKQSVLNIPAKDIRVVFNIAIVIVKW